MIEWIVTSSILIVIVIALRYIFRGRISPRILYALWALVLVRLLVPVSFGKTGVSVLNALPEAAERGAAEVQAGEGAFTEASESVGHNGEEAAPEATAETVKPARPTQQAEKPAAPTQTAAEDPTEKPTGNPTENPSGGPGEAQSEKTEGPGAIAAVTDENDGNGERQKAVDIYRILNIVFLIGAAAAAAVLFAVNLKFGLKLKRSRRPLESAGCRLPVYITEAIDTPCLFGLFRPAIYITPETAENRKTLSHIIAHESAHFSHGDHIFALLRCVCLVLHWYNPLVWIAAMLSSRDSELACDEAAVKTLGESERAEYGRTLIALTNTDKRGLMTSALMLNGGSSARGLKERITMITKKPKTKWFVLAGVLLAAAIAIIITFTGANGKKNGEDGAKDAQTAESPTPEGTETPGPSAEPSPAPEITPAPTPEPSPIPKPILPPKPTPTSEPPTPTPIPLTDEAKDALAEKAWQTARYANDYGFDLDSGSWDFKQESEWNTELVRITFSSERGEVWCWLRLRDGEWTPAGNEIFPSQTEWPDEYERIFGDMLNRPRRELIERSVAEFHPWYDENGEQGLNFQSVTPEELAAAGYALTGDAETDYLLVSRYAAVQHAAQYVNC
jgi:beta-lactamase regulating signal transducer with metallopeptidase domain